VKRRRIIPLEPDQWSDATRALLGGARLSDRDAPKPPNILRTIAHHPRLLQPFLAFAATLAIGGVLPRRDSELLALRTAWNCACAFEWGHHVIYARSAGLSETEILRVARGPDVSGWSARDRALLSAADELHAHDDVTPETWDALAGSFDDAELVEVTFVVGNYTMLSMVANATGVPLELDLPPLPDRALPDDAGAGG
jgi:alkylhydroperoxidase family enzyme